MSEAVEWREEFAPIRHQVSFGNSVFILCTSLAGVDITKMASRFGRFVVQLDDPRGLAQQIDKALQNTGERFLVVGKPVSYNRGERVPDGEDESQLTDLAYTQKSPSFAAESEFRFCLIGMESRHLTHLEKRVELDVDLGQSVLNATLIRPPYPVFENRETR